VGYDIPRAGFKSGVRYNNIIPSPGLHPPQKSQERFHSNFCEGEGAKASRGLRN